DEEVAGVEAEAEALAAAGEIDQLGGLVEVTGEEPFVAGGLLDQQRAGVRLLQRLGDHLGGSFQRRLERVGFLRSAVQSHALVARDRVRQGAAGRYMRSDQHAKR